MNSDMFDKKIKREFIKSTAILVLAMILLVTAVVAWFVTSTTNDIEDFLLSVEAEDGGVYLGDSVAITRSIVLPCATKVDDSTISVNDLTKAIHVEIFQVKADSSVTEAVISVTSDESDVHYYIDGYYDSNDTLTSIAEIIKDDNGKTKEFRDQNLTIDFTADNLDAYERTVAVVFWAEYTDSSSQAIKNGNMSFDALVKFSAAD